MAVSDSTPASVCPRHIAIIMDGNGRWAGARGFDRIKGHEEGVHSVRAITRACRRKGVEALTLYSFSSENWGRPDDEVTALMGLLLQYLEAERDEILDNQIRLTHSGEVERLPRAVQTALEVMEGLSADNEGMVLNLALSYGSRQEIVRAVRSVAGRVERGELRADEIDEEHLESALYTAGLPDPDLVIRTSGELRLSNFLLWQVAYAEIYVTPVPWPEFREAQLEEALEEFARRQRRFGLTGQQIEDGLLENQGNQ
ncbi:MAG: isoprenyl transferase [Myxococcota bacterium]|nr:isoprenyl transferase [Myxococcota bacterium]